MSSQLLRYPSFLFHALVATHFLYNVGRADFTQMGNIFYKKIPFAPLFSRVKLGQCTPPIFLSLSAVSENNFANGTTEASF